MSDDRLFDEDFLKRLERLTIIFRHNSNSQIGGEHRSSRRGHSVEFSDFRPYVMGDDFRRIDWNAYARLERLFLKLFIEEEDITLHLLIDTSYSMDWGEPNKLQYAVQVAGVLGYISLVGLDRVAASTLPNRDNSVRRYFPPVRGKQSAVKLFAFLQSTSTCSDPMDASKWLGSYSANTGNPGVIILLSDLMGEGWQNGLSHLSRCGHEISIVHILSPDEAKPVLAGDFRLIDSESRSEIEFTADFETLDRYRQHLETWQTSWRNFCRARSISYIPVLTTLLLEDLLFAHLPKHGILR